MKKNIILYAAFAAVILAAASCGKEKQPSPVGDVDMASAASAEVARTIAFDKQESLPLYTDGEGTEYSVLSLEFTEGNRYIAILLPPVESGTKAPANARAEAGKYSWDGEWYRCEGWFKADVCIGETVPDAGPASVAPTAVVIVANGSENSYPATVNSMVASSQQQVNASRNWKVESSLVKIAGNGIAIEAGFKGGCDFHQIASYAAQQGAKINVDDFVGYDIRELIFDGADNLMVCFSGASAFYGSYTLDGNDIAYSFTIGGNEFMNASATGTLAFPAQGRAVLELFASSKGYSGSMVLELSQVD